MAPPKVIEDYYKILEVVQTATVDTITQSYRRLARKWHPDKNFGNDTTEAFKLLSQAYETLKDEHKRRQYDANDYPGVRSQQESRQRPEVQSDVTRLAELQKAKRERTATWNPKKQTLDSTIFDLRRDERRIQREIDNLASIAAAERAAEAAKNSWGTWLTSPFYRKAPPETEEQIARKDIKRQERRMEKDMKERRLGSVKEKLKAVEKTLKTGQVEFDAATAWDEAKIQKIEKKMAAEEEARQAEIHRREQARQAEIRRQEQERLAKQQREAQEAWRKQWAEEVEAMRRETTRQAERRAAERERERLERESRLHDYLRPMQGQRFGGEASRVNKPSSCLHHGWWDKVHGRMACPRCHDAWNYLLQCPGCEMRACPKCQAAVRPRGRVQRARRARIPSPEPIYHDWYD